MFETKTFETGLKMDVTLESAKKIKRKIFNIL